MLSNLLVAYSVFFLLFLLLLTQSHRRTRKLTSVSTCRNLAFSSSSSSNSSSSSSSQFNWPGLSAAYCRSSSSSSSGLFCGVGCRAMTARCVGLLYSMIDYCAPLACTKRYLHHHHHHQQHSNSDLIVMMMTTMKPPPPPMSTLWQLLSQTNRSRRPRRAILLPFVLKSPGALKKPVWMGIDDKPIAAADGEETT